MALVLSPHVFRLKQYISLTLKALRIQDLRDRRASAFILAIFITELAGRTTKAIFAATDIQRAVKTIFGSVFSAFRFGVTGALTTIATEVGAKATIPCQNRQSR